MEVNKNLTHGERIERNANIALGENKSKSIDKMIKRYAEDGETLTEDDAWAKIKLAWFDKWERDIKTDPAPFVSAVWGLSPQRSRDKSDFIMGLNYSRQQAEIMEAVRK